MRQTLHSLRPPSVPNYLTTDNRQDIAFRQMVDDIYGRMTSGVETGANRDGLFPGTGIGMILPRVSTNTMAGLMEAVAEDPFKGRADLPLLAERTQLEADELFLAAETLQLLRFADLIDGDIKLTPDGIRFAGSGVDERKSLFREHLTKYVPLVAHIKRVLDERPSHRAPLLRFQDELEDHMSDEAAETTIRNIINWSRYAEVLSYDESSGALSLENPM